MCLFCALHVVTEGHVAGVVIARRKGYEVLETIAFVAPSFREGTKKQRFSYVRLLSPELRRRDRIELNGKLVSITTICPQQF